MDFNGDINAMDSSAVLNHFYGFRFLTGEALLAGDVDGDGSVDAIDALKERGKIIEDNFIIEKGRMHENDDECVIAVSSKIDDAEWNSLDIGDTITLDSVSTDRKSVV